MEVSKDFCQHFYEFWKETGILAAILEEEMSKCSEEIKNQS